MASTTPLLEMKDSDEIRQQRGKTLQPKEKKKSSEDSTQRKEFDAQAFATALALSKLKTKSHSLQIGKKYAKRFCIYLFAIATFVLFLYFLAPIFDVPPTYLIVPLFSAIGGTLVASKVNKLIDSAGFCVPKWMLDENSQILVDAEQRLEELRELDKKSGKDDYATVIQELDNNVSVCQAINEAGSKHFVNLFVKDIKILMRIPCRSMSEVYSSAMTESKIRKRRAKVLAQGRKLFAPYDLQSKHTLSTFMTEVMDKILTPKGYNKCTRVKPLLLNGSPGIGKTFLIKSLGNIFNVPVCVINMGKETLEKVEGVLLSSSSGTGPMPIAGLILKDLTNPHTNPSGCKDIFVLLDEIDKAFVGAGKEQSITEGTAKFISFLHHFLQVDILKMHDKGYNVMYGIENVYVVCTANRNCFMDSFIEPSTRASLMDRVNVINMPDLTKTSKIKILKSKLKEKLEADEGLSPLQKILMEQFMGRIIMQIVDEQEAAKLKIEDVPNQTRNKETSAKKNTASVDLKLESKETADTETSQKTKNTEIQTSSAEIPDSCRENKASSEAINVPPKNEQTTSDKTTAKPSNTVQSANSISAQVNSKISEISQKEQTGLRKALELLDVYYLDHYILLEERYGMKSLARIIEDYLEVRKELGPDQDSEDSCVMDILPDEETMTPLLDAHRSKEALKRGANNVECRSVCQV